MDVMKIIDIVLVVLLVIVYAIKGYFKAKSNIVGAVSELIALAESTGLPGKEKMAKVVAELAERVPAPLKKWLSEETLQKIAQHIFDWMRRYADAYIEATENADYEEEREALFKAEAKEIGLDMIAEIVHDLYDLTMDMLKEKADEYGIGIEDGMDRAEIIRRIVAAILNKA